MAVRTDIPRLRFVPVLRQWRYSSLPPGERITPITGAEERWREASGPVFDAQRRRKPMQEHYLGERCRYTCGVCRLILPGLPQRRVCPSPLCQWLDAVHRREARRRRPRPDHCRRCGQMMTMQRRTKLYCGPACKQRSYRTQRRVRLQRRTGFLSVEGIYPRLTARLRAMQADGLTNREIATRLNRQGVPTVNGQPRWDADMVLGFTMRGLVCTVPTTA